MRARTSSLRLVSCVQVVSMLAGQCSARSWLRRWKMSAVVPKCSGSPPTSLSETSRL